MNTVQVEVGHYLTINWFQECQITTDNVLIYLHHLLIIYWLYWLNKVPHVQLNHQTAASAPDSLFVFHLTNVCLSLSPLSLSLRPSVIYSQTKHRLVFWKSVRPPGEGSIAGSWRVSRILTFLALKTRTHTEKDTNSTDPRYGHPVQSLFCKWSGSAFKSALVPRGDWAVFLEQRWDLVALLGLLKHILQHQVQRGEAGRGERGRKPWKTTGSTIQINSKQGKTCNLKKQ